MSQLDGSGTLETASELALAAFLRPYALENLTEVVQKLTGGGYSSVDSLRGMDDKSVRDIYIEGDDAEKLLLATFLYGNDMPQYGEGFTSIGCTSLLRAFALSDAALQQAQRDEAELRCETLQTEAAMLRALLPKELQAQVPRTPARDRSPKLLWRAAKTQAAGSERRESLFHARARAALALSTDRGPASPTSPSTSPSISAVSSRALSLPTVPPSRGGGEGSP